MYREVLAAEKRLAGVAHQTPVLTSSLLNRHTGNEIYLKCENLQRIGAFKFRGAYNAVSCLTDEQKRQGVVTFSSGNHAQATALACQLQGIKAVVIMPVDAPAVKLAATSGYGAEIVTYDKNSESREQIAQELIKKHGYTLIPPFNHPQVIGGQGTAAKELIDEIGALDYLFVQCGGGGLLSGCAVIAKYLLPDCQVIGVEPELGDDATRSFKTGVLQTVHNPATIADGLRTACLGDITFPLIREYVDDMVTVPEQAILDTMYYLWTRLKIIAEPSGAVSLAPLFTKSLPLRNKKIGVIISGGNVDVRLANQFFAGIKE